MPAPISGLATVTVFAAPTSWIESGAVAQCHQVAALPGMLDVAGMPDLHPGKGAPIGAAMRSTVLYPLLVGSDIGCGNHFVELARVDNVFAPEHASRVGLAAGDLVLIVHSGSRGLGERILRAHTEAHGAGPAADPAAYLAAHDEAVRWSSLNRRLMAARVAHALGAAPTEPVVDECHNLVELRDGVHLHRKGAAPGDGRYVLVAGTRGTRSYLVAGHAGPEANHSVAHGAGRKMSRADALRRGRAKHTVEELRRTPVGSLVVCGDRQLLFEEAPTAYKRIEQVIGDLTDHGLATPVATTVPLVTYKTAAAPAPPAPREARPGRRAPATASRNAVALRGARPRRF